MTGSCSLRGHKFHFRIVQFQYLTSPPWNHAIHAQQLYVVIINEIEDSGVFLLICNKKCTFIGQNRSTVHILHPVLRMFRAIRSLVSFQ